MTIDHRIVYGLAIIIGLILLIGVVKAFLTYIPFYAPSYFIWGGIFIGIVCVIDIIFSIRFFGVETRKFAIILLLLVGLLAIVSLLWPTSISVSDKPRQRLDDFLPRFQSSEYHEEIVDVPVDKLQEAVMLVSIGDIPAANLLLRLRFLFSDKPYVRNSEPFLDLGGDSGFLVLDDSDPGERVYGMVGKPWDEDMSLGVRNADQFNAFNTPGNIKVAFNFKIEDKGKQGTLISTETRNLGNDEPARRIFARYWRVIYPGSSIIRRVWLNAIIRKAKTL